jgi:prepilin-type N-terminal cleavage/methylation domain-containing protein/prepilin-type processing-associated H-X9-DG protein
MRSTEPSVPLAVADDGAPGGFGATPGFTLVELLVTVAVIALLAALMLPALAAVREKGRGAQCLSNQRQWGLAFRLYVDDNEDFLPRRGQGMQPVTRLDRPEDWFNALPPYLDLVPYAGQVAAGRRPRAHENSVFVCPVANDPGAAVFLSYGMNMNLSPWNLPQATRLSAIREPVRVVSLGEGPGAYASTYPSAKPYSVVARHARRVNLLFLDGHAQAFSGPYVGCGSGDPRRADVSWLTGTESDANADNY